MPCEHLGPTDVMHMAEGLLRERGVPEELWPGTSVIHGENTPGTMWAAIVTGLERRGANWIVTQLDRRKEPLADGDVGLRVIPATEQVEKT
jgi:hypothetical protein